MEEDFKVFTKGFDKILDLIELGDDEVCEKYKKYMSMVPSNVLDAVSESKDFETGNSQFTVDFMRYENAVSLDFIRKNKYLRSEVYIHRLHEEDLSPKKIFSLKVRNTKNKKEDLKFYYVEKDGKYDFVGTNDKPNEINVDISWEVYLNYNDFGPYLEYIKSFRGMQIYSRTIQLTFDELTQYFETEEKCGDDWEIEFDADFDV